MASGRCMPLQGVSARSCGCTSQPERTVCREWRPPRLTNAAVVITSDHAPSNRLPRFIAVASQTRSPATLLHAAAGRTATVNGMSRLRSGSRTPQTIQNATYCWQLLRKLSPSLTAAMARHGAAKVECGPSFPALIAVSCSVVITSNDRGDSERARRRVPLGVRLVSSAALQGADRVETSDRHLATDVFFGFRACGFVTMRLVLPSARTGCRRILGEHAVCWAEP